MDSQGVMDVNIDNVLALWVDVDNSMERMEGPTLLEIDTISHPTHRNDLLPKEDMEACSKLKAQAAIEENKTILG